MQDLAASPKDVLEQALLEASSGEPNARIELDRVLDQYEALLRSDNSLFASVLYTALKGSDLEAASGLIGRKWGTGTWFKVEVGNTLHFEVLRWRIEGRRQSSLQLHHHVPESKTLRGFLDRLTGILSILTAYCLDESCEPGELYVNLGDHGHIPGLAFSDSRPNYFLVPDSLFLMERGYEAMRKSEAEEGVDWDRRVPIGFWRGVTTGYPADRALGWRSLPRIKLCAIAREHPDLLDAGISQAVQGASEKELRTLGFMRSHVPQKEFGKYKYQIDIDGNTNSWPGLFQKLLTGSPVLKVASPYRQWYYEKLRPWVNFIPVASDLSDLVEKLAWLRSNDAVARRIGEAGKHLAEALDYSGEIARSGRIVTAALRYFGGCPEVALRFGAGRSDNRFLTAGWGVSNPESVPSLASVSTIVMPRPVARADFDLGLEVSPILVPPEGPTQELGVAVNGKLVLVEDVAERKIVRCSVPSELIKRFDDLCITLLHPNAAARASAQRPLDDRIVSISLHALTLTAPRSSDAGVRHDVPARAASGQVLSSGSRPVARAALNIRQGNAMSEGSTSPKVHPIMLQLFGADIYDGFVPAFEANTQGWNSYSSLFESSILETKPNVIIDVGVWKGASTIELCRLQRLYVDDGAVIAVDTFLGSPEHFQMSDLFARRHGFPLLYEQFLANVVRQGMHDSIVPLAQTSLNAASILSRLGIRAGLVHVDAAHDYDSVLADARAYWRLLEPGGWLIGDDYHESWPGVVKAADQFAAEVGADLSINGPKWMVRKQIL